jgi:phospholipid/cholesterol/gamma-HCH transport system substrate-binding protein
METRASYIAVGASVLLAVLSLVGFVVWLSVTSLNRDTDRYLIYFVGSVTGLQAGNPVRYHGISVGQVSRVRVDPTNIEQVEVTIDVSMGTPIVAGAIASLDLQGITGDVYVSITGGMQGNPYLTPAEGRPYPVIPSQPSTLQQLAMTVPEILDNAGRLLVRANSIFSAENQRTFSRVLDNLEHLSSDLANQTAKFSVIMQHLEQVSSDLNTLIAEARVDAIELSEQTSRTLDMVGDTIKNFNQQVTATRGDVHQAATSVVNAASQLTAGVAENRPNIEDFTVNGLHEFSRMVAEFRELAQNLSHFAKKVEKDPSQFFFGDSDQGIPIQ